MPFLINPLTLPNRCLQLLFELLDNFFVSGVYFGIGQRFLTAPISESVGNALLSFGDVFPAEDIEEFDVLEIGGLGLLHEVENRIVTHIFRHEHRYIAADGWEGW